METKTKLDYMFQNILDTYKAYGFWMQSEHYDHAERNERLIKYDLKRILATKLESMTINF